MSIQDSSFTPTPSMDEFDNNETIDGIELGEMVDLNNSQTDGLMAAGALEEQQNTGYGRGIPITTIASESTFSAGKRIIDPKRASIKTQTV
ncbi:hypothetical protein LIER_11354 [Lithospermum erythrorhizon]|uniref:HAT C-terminal dimerisation domain-containing protein n=1 Tax=Lithospermum erythrorhizon TaxID=34254 RepID=A0AAV3PRR1_LITER